MPGAITISAVPDLVPGFVGDDPDGCARKMKSCGKLPSRNNRQVNTAKPIGALSGLQRQAPGFRGSMTGILTEHRVPERNRICQSNLNR